MSVGVALFEVEAVVLVGAFEVEVFERSLGAFEVEAVVCVWVL